jgi:hypothetical protein
VTATDITIVPYEDLGASLHGELITPGEPGYDAARAAYNGMIDRRPAAIGRCRDVADVIAGVQFGREHGIEIAAYRGN